MDDGDIKDFNATDPTQQDEKVVFSSLEEARASLYNKKIPLGLKQFNEGITVNDQTLQLILDYTRSHIESLDDPNVLSRFDSFALSPNLSSAEKSTYIAYFFLDYVYIPTFESEEVRLFLRNRLFELPVWEIYSNAIFVVDNQDPFSTLKTQMKAKIKKRFGNIL